jgi:CheY-like chemotaxis protein
MPIVDGLTSTKMIRSFEKATPGHSLSARARYNKRIPIIAVSASLLEKERQSYIDAGFDAWILKPISFPRLSELLRCIIDPDMRNENIYREGWEWERGGWFHEADADAFAAMTEPSGEPPVENPTEELQMAAADADPQGMGDDTQGRQPEEQHRLMESQEKQIQEREKPEMGRSLSTDDEGNEQWEESRENQPPPSPMKPSG